MVENERDRFKREFKKRLYAFTLALIRFIETLPSDNVSRRLGDQLIRSGTSVIGNYVEAQSASSKKDYTNYFVTALKSSNESKLWLSLLKDTGKAASKDYEFLMRELHAISNIIATSILTLKGKR